MKTSEARACLRETKAKKKAITNDKVEGKIKDLLVFISHYDIVNSIAYTIFLFFLSIACTVS